jgi:hypothetical protein
MVMYCDDDSYVSVVDLEDEGLGSSWSLSLIRWWTLGMTQEWWKD